ncbi:hypothetical protein ACQ4WX_25815 [Streptomyces lasalocidi]
MTQLPLDVLQRALPEKLAAVPSNHSPHFAPDLSVIAPGVRTLVSAALTLLPSA